MPTFFLFLSCLFVLPVQVAAVIIDFDGLSDSDAVTNQFAAQGVLFENATVLTAGISLNEFEFPPVSLDNVISDDGGPITLTFTPLSVFSFGGFFTYLVPITVSAFDASNTLIASATSAFFSNLALSGDGGSSPNELLTVSFAGGITKVIIEGDPLGGSFTVDNINFSSIPEPSTLLLLATGLGALAWRMRVRLRTS